MTEIVVVDNADIPYDIAESVKTVCGERDIVQKVIFGAHFKELQGTEDCRPSLSALDIDNKTIIVDIYNCLRDNRWSQRKGMRFVVNYLLNLMFGLFHELYHLEQITAQPELKDETDEEILQLIETEANEAADWGTLRWAKDIERTPTITDLGWAAELTIDVLNGIYAEMPEWVCCQLDTEGTIAGAQATVAAEKARWSVDDTTKLITDIRAGLIGIVINDVEYLTIHEAMDISCGYETEGGSNDTTAANGATTNGV